MQNNCQNVAHIPYFFSNAWPEFVLCLLLHNTRKLWWFISTSSFFRSSLSCKYVFDQCYKYVILVQWSSAFSSVYAKLRKLCSEWMSWGERFCASASDVRRKERKQKLVVLINLNGKWRTKVLWKTGAMQQQYMNEVTRWDWIEYVLRAGCTVHTSLMHQHSNAISVLLLAQRVPSKYLYWTHNGKPTDGLVQNEANMVGRLEKAHFQPKGINIIRAHLQIVCIECVEHVYLSIHLFCCNLWRMYGTHSNVNGTFSHKYPRFLHNF